MPDPYTIASTLCEGAGSAVYRGVSRRDGAGVIIRTIPDDVQGSGGARRLRREYETLSQLDSPFVLRPYRLDTQRRQPRLIMEDFDGQPLSSLLGRPLAIDRFLDIAVQLANALADVHRQGIVHKDLKPDNILIQPRTGAIKLIGFDVAAPALHTAIAPDSVSRIEGSLAYVSPEQTGRMNRGVDHRSDFYSLGVVFYELLTGELPFQTAGDDLELLHCHLAQPPTPLHAHDEAIPEAISRVVTKLLAKMAEDRYQTAGGLKADLERCAAEWQSHKGITPFPLGRRDVPGHLLIPKKLYGRELEVGALLAAFDQVVASGKPTLVLVSGYSGIGKSAVVNELHKALVLPHALFAGGKFDQYKRDIPYATLAQALRALVRQVLGKNEEEIVGWRKAIQEAVGPNGRLVTDLVPDLVALIGEQPPVQEVPPQDAQNRFNMVFRRLLAAFARPEHRLVLFLDDLQWLDAATLRLLEHLLTHPAVKHILLVGAYRDNEVGPSHPLMLALDSMEKAGAAVESIVLAPLGEEHVLQFTADAFHCRRERAEPLARLVHEKTGGNPFFMIQFVTELVDEGLVVFDDRVPRWQWDLDRIRGKGLTDNLADLMVGKLSRFGAGTQEFLQHLACLGSRANLATMARVEGIAEEEVEGSLLEAIQAGFVLRQDDSVSFLHDRVQEAAYALIPLEARPGLHLEIGRKLLSQTAPEELGDILFDVVNHLNRGTGLMTDVAERTRLAELNVAAGKRARSSVAYATARDCFAAAAALLSEETWDAAYDFTFDLYLDWAECEYLSGATDEAEPLLERLLAQAQGVLDQARVYGLRLTLCTIGGKYDDALAAGLHGLQLLGVQLPEDDAAINREIEAEAEAAAAKWQGREIAELAEAPAPSDPRIRAVIALLTNCGAPAYIGSRPQLFPLLNLKNVNHSLEFGPVLESCLAYCGYAFMLVSIFGDIRSGFEFSEMAIELSQRFEDSSTTGAVHYLHANHVDFWLEPFASALPILEQGFRICVDAGNVAFANYIAYSIVWQAVERGDTLADVLSLSRQFASFSLGSGNEALHQTIVLEQQLLKSLMGKTDGGASFSDEGIDELSCVKKIAGGSFSCGIMYYHTMKTMAAYLMGDDAASRTHAEEAKKLLAAAMAQPMEAMYYFLHALVLTREYREAAEGERGEILTTLVAYQQKLAIWAVTCPANFVSKHALVSAEIAEIEGDDLSAERLFEQAIDAATSNGFIHWEAMANEAAARFHGSRGHTTASRAHLREARRCYARWGAAAKVEQLGVLHPWLAQEASAIRGTIAAPTEKLDVMAISKAHHAISSEINLDRLAQTLLRIVLETAGARTGFLFMEGAGELRAEVQPDDAGKQRIVFNASRDAGGYPEAIVNYVRRSRNTVALGDARVESEELPEDAYLRQVEPKSVLCMPIQRQKKLLAVLYLENNLVAGAFTAEHRAVVEVLAAQAAISLETAQLYADLQLENAERRHVEEEIRRLNQELEQRVLDRTAELEAANEELEAFASSVSHDLRAPLRHISGFLVLLEKKLGGTLDQQGRHYVDTISDSTRRMEALIDDLLCFSRMGRWEMKWRAVDLGAIARDVIGELEPDTAGRKIDWRVADLPTVSGDAAMLRIVVTNLLSNAAKFTRPRRQAVIEVGCQYRDEGTVVFVRDNGVGFDPTYAARLFGVFQRLHTADKFEGTGVGLAIVQRIIHRHGGRVWAEGGTDEGATFGFLLPRQVPGGEAPTD